MWSPAGSLAIAQAVPDVHPPEVSGVGTQPGFHVSAPTSLMEMHAHPEFQVWAPGLLIWVRTTRLQVRAGAAYPPFTVQGLRG